MATNTMPITAAQVRQMAAEFGREMNQSRRIPAMPPMLQGFSRENTVHIFSVSPWPFERLLGSAGTFLVPKCDPSKEYAGPLSIPGIVNELIPTNEREFELRQEPGGGAYLAQQILGEGPHLNPSESLRKYGVFVARQVGFPNGKIPVPGKDEIAAANEALGKTLMDLVIAARQASAAGAKDAAAEIRPELHHVAARLLAGERFGFQINLDSEDWIVNHKPSTREKCMFCGVMIDHGLMKCPNCKEVLRPAEYEAAKARLIKK